LKHGKLRYFILAGLVPVLIFSFLMHSVRSGFAFSGCEENCQKCHSLSDAEVKFILEKMKVDGAKVLKVQMSPVKGLWEVAFEEKGKRGVFYVDFSRKYIVAGGSIVEVNAALNKTKERLDELNRDKRINPAGIPLRDALVLGSNSATKKIVVFTDPDCPYCARLHQEIKKVVTQRMDIAFYLKLLPLKIHPDAYWKSKSIVCEKSLRLLEENFEKKPIPRSECDKAEPDNTVKFAEKNGISGTPTMVLPDGSLYQGPIEADKLIKLIDDSSKAAAGKKKKKT
jgi:thiol:disulfide interchange protein DsbC